jgi:hypothetical protein
MVSDDHFKCQEEKDKGGKDKGEKTKGRESNPYSTPDLLGRRR